MDSNRTDPGAGYETTDAAVGPLVRWGVILALVTAGSFLTVSAVTALFAHIADRSERPPPPMMETERSLPPQPRLQVQPSSDLERFRAEEEAKLEGYAWVDRANGVIQIPIERAMAVIAERGLPVREGGAGGEEGAR